MQTIAPRSIAVITCFLLAGCNQSSNNAEPQSNKSAMSTTNANAEDRAIAALVRKDAAISVDDHGNVKEIFLADASLSDSEVQHFAHFPTLVKLELMTCEVGDAIWPYLSNLHELESLTLWGSAITDEGMENLRYLPKLRELDIRTTQITDRGLAHVAQLRSLEKLELLGTRITGDGLAHLRGLTKLKELGLVNTHVDDDGLKFIRELSGLTELSLEGSDITNDGLPHVGQLTNLEVLTIHNTAINERGLKHLEGLANLRTFYLCVPVTEVGLPSLKKMAKLADLYIGDVADESRDFLQSQLPEVGVY